MGLFFHTVTIITLRIHFYFSMVLYASFVDWNRVSRALFTRRGHPLVFAFDGGCTMCRTTATVLARSALPGGIEFIAAQDAVNSPRVSGRAQLAELVSEIHLFTPSETLRGLAAYRRLAWRVPLLWPALPLLYLPPVEQVGQRVYRRIASGRACSTDTRIGAVRHASSSKDAWTLVPTGIGAIILALALAAAVTNKASAWPIALYPTFAGRHSAQVDRLHIVASTPDGTRTPVSLHPCFSWMPPERYAGLIRASIARADSGQRQMLRSLISTASQACPGLVARAASTLSFYTETVATAPTTEGQVIRRRLLFRWHVRSLPA